MSLIVSNIAYFFAMERHDITQSAKLECVPVESDWAQLCEELEKRSIMVISQCREEFLLPRFEPFLLAASSFILQCSY